MSEKRRALGKGLDALFPSEGDSVSSPFDESSVTEIPIATIETNPHQPRKEFNQEAIAELSASVAQRGILQPILVTKTRKGYQVIAGERRLRAAKVAGLKTVPVFVRPFAERERLEVALIENLQRRDLSPLEEARAFLDMMETLGIGQQEVAEKVGKDRSSIANSLRLLKLPEEMQKALSSREISSGHARALLSIEDPRRRQTLFNAMVRDRISVREAERFAAPLKRSSLSSAGAIEKRAPDLVAIEQKFIDRLGMKISIKGRLSKGKVEISYFSHDDLIRLYERLS